MKYCSRCKTEKQEYEFGKRKSAKDGFHPWCKDCIRQYSRDRYKKNSESIKAASQSYRDANRDLVRSRDRAHFKTEKEKRSEWFSEYYQKNRNSILKRVSEYGKKHRHKKREHEKKYREKNRGKRREQSRRYYYKVPKEQLRKKAIRNSHIRRARKRNNAIIAFSQGRLEERMAFWKNKCWMCGGSYDEIDHVKPLSKGGLHALVNLRPICHDCNMRKSNKWPLSEVS